MRGRVEAAVRVVTEDQLPDRAAALTYFGLLAIFPALIVLVGILELTLRSTPDTDAVVDGFVELLPAGAAGVGPVLSDALRERTAAGTVVGVGLLASVWAVSGYVAACQRAISAIRGMPDTRLPWVAKLSRLPLTLLMLALLAGITLALLAGGPLGGAIERAVGLPYLVAVLWHWARWPLLFVVLLIFFGLLHRGLPAAQGAPNGRTAWVSRGGVVGVLLWLAGSGAFSWYNANFATGYGALGTAVVFLAWLWVGHFALLVGVEIDLRTVRRTDGS
ncbi:YihY/virulence factor BrkB family protein [Amycolatopsis rhabdoformis]|uniref:YihY/virulence factor BrkB family protein n=1 Tax=Amycolatopsis rhabdoformis TaxID=1448059 RepID=A0ABZ1IF84_9PSEU|nr:YihY/virulence factor BrkB family protein [Amycolatopsis rhabdoformis]WSE32363.1 YihY/virulence factor BrkB family protein [Amycolatopsis rhabdoformis]